MANDTPNCNCLTGTPYIDSEGNCRCANDSVLPPLAGGGVRIPIRRPQTVNYTYNFPFTPQPAVDALANKAEGKILGMPPLVVLGIAAAGVYFFSQKDAKN